MKKALIILFTFAAFLSYAQERVNQAPLKFSQQSQILNSATYWNYDKHTGVWDSTQNKRDVGSFDTMQVVSIDLNGSIVYAFVAATKTWGYEYPELKIGYYENNIWRILCVDAKTYKKMMKPSNTPAVFKVKESEVKKVEDVPYEIRRMYTAGAITGPDWEFGVYKATDGNIRFACAFRLMSDWTNLRYFETPESEWNKLNLGK